MQLQAALTPGTAGFQPAVLRARRKIVIEAWNWLGLTQHARCVRSQVV